MTGFISQIRSWIILLDERAKLVAAFLTGTCAIACIRWESETLLLGVSLLLCALCRAVRGVLIFVGALCLLGAGILLYRRITGADNFAGIGIFFLILKFGPFCAMTVFLYNTMNTALFLRALARMQVPSFILVPLGVTFRFMPSFIREFSHIRDALAFRRMILGPKTILTRPFKVMESVLIPLLMRTLFIGEELSRAALARGIDAPGRPTSIHEIRFKLQDLVWTLVWITGIVLVLYFDRQGG